MTTNALVTSVTTREPEIKEHIISHIWDLVTKWNTLQIPINQTQPPTAQAYQTYSYLL
jgi:hypothetical protein